jgi:cyanophycinase-like exopeptidase
VKPGESIRRAAENVEQANGVYAFSDTRITINDVKSPRFRTELVGAAPSANVVENFWLGQDGTVIFRVKECPCINGVQVVSFGFQYKLIEPTANGTVFDIANVTVQIGNSDLVPNDDVIHLDKEFQTAPAKPARLILPTELLENDTKPAGTGQGVEVQIARAPTYGTLTNELGGLYYRPHPNWMNIAIDDDGDLGDSFEYRLYNTTTGQVSEKATVELRLRRYVCGTSGVYDDDEVGSVDIASDFGLAVVGGGNDEFMIKRLFDAANGGDIVVIKAAGSGSGYPRWFCSYPLGASWGNIQRPQSVTMFIVDSVQQANSTEIAKAISKSEAIYIGGGDQATYLDIWPNSAVGNALATRAQTTFIAGTSAGMAILGAIDYSGMNGSADSYTALRNPFDFTVQDFRTSFLPFGVNLHETHFYERDRMGRALAFAARNPSSPILAADEATGYDYSTGEVLGSGYVYIISGGNPAQAGQPVTGTFNIQRKRRNPVTDLQEQDFYTLTVDSSQKLHSSIIENGVSLVYGFNRPNPRRSND